MLGQMKRQLEYSRCFRQGMEKDLEECAEARWRAKYVLDYRALALDSDNVRLQGPGVMSFEKKHKVIIDRFGRYPHRNAILGRSSTPEELTFLTQPNSSF